MERDQHPPAEIEQPPAADAVTSRTVALPTGRPSRGSRPAARRPWSERRTPAAITALAIAAASGTLLYDVVRVRASQTASAWRRHLADELASRPLDDTMMQAGAALVAALGLWLIVLALSPGLRHRLPLVTPDPQLRAVLDRQAAELRMRDTAMRVPGVSAARVRFLRRFLRHRVAVRADVRFRAPADVKADLRTALMEEADRLALARPPSLDVRVRPHRS